MPRPTARTKVTATCGSAPEQSLQRTVADYLALCVPAPPEGPWWTAVNPIPAKSRPRRHLQGTGAQGRNAGYCHVLEGPSRWCRTQGRARTVEPGAMRDARGDRPGRRYRDHVPDARRGDGLPRHAGSPQPHQGAAMMAVVEMPEIGHFRPNCYPPTLPAGRSVPSNGGMPPCSGRFSRDAGSRGRTWERPT